MVPAVDKNAYCDPMSLSHERAHEIARRGPNKVTYYLTMALLVPILRVAYLLRGGRLAWVWWALGISGAAWLLYDAREWVSAAMANALSS